MIKFFRQIRKRLINQSRVRKYLLYAIGEIILVVIGILIALQVNNLNEKSKRADLEQKILKELLIDLSIAKSDLENDIKINKEIVEVAEKLKVHIYLKKPYNDGIEEQMISSSNITQFSPRTSGYQNLKSEGVSLISNDSLRKEISNLFEINFPSAVRMGREFDQLNNSTINLNPFFRKYFDIDMTDTLRITYRENSYTLNTSPPIINDYNKLVADKEFINVLQKTIFDRANKISNYVRVSRKINRVNSLIKEELKLLEN